MTAPHPHWLVPLDDGSPSIRIEIRSEHVVPPCVHINVVEPIGRLMTPMEACRLGMALQDASKYAAELWAKQENRRKRG